MLQSLTSYQINALKQLTVYRKKFYDTGHTNSLKKHKKEAVQGFIDIFCQHNFADTDYNIIQQEIQHFSSVEEWIMQASLSAVLKCFTYYIWTDKIMDGYFITRIDNRSVELLLLRLEALLQEEKILA